MMVNSVQRMTDVLALESKCVLNYVVHSAWPAHVDKDDQEAQTVLDAAWREEEPFLERLVELVSDWGGATTLFGTFRLAPARLNFARAAHVVEVAPALIDEEVRFLQAIRSSTENGSPFAQLLDDLLAVKEGGLETLRSLAKKQVAARAKAKDKTKTKTTTEKKPAGGDDAFAFRDPDMPLEERMASAKSQPLANQLWAAMAQTDCTACGYDCEGYAKAIASGEEKDLTKCVPGEDETAKTLKKLMKA